MISKLSCNGSLLKMANLKRLLNDTETLVVPDAYDSISARLIEYCGFKSVQCSGYSFSISKKLCNENLLSVDDNLSKTKEIVSAVDIPVMADGEDGYGYKDIFKNNIVKFMNTGIAGINIEDQNLWNPYDSEKIVPFEIMKEKIFDVIKIKKELNIPDFILNARTDSLRIVGKRIDALKVAIERSNQYLELGADISFITAVKTKEEIKLLKKEINGPISIAAGLVYNINEFSIKDCMEIGVARVSLPSVLIFGAMKSAKDILMEISTTNNFDNIIGNERLMNSEILDELLGQF